MSAYYLLASLPGLSYGARPPVERGEFLARCESQLSAPDFEAVRALLAGDESAATHGFSREWFGLEAELRNALVRHRAALAGVDPAPFRREGVSERLYAIEAVEDAFERPNPLEREVELDRYRWSVVEDLERGHFFDLTAVLAYALKLRILERWQAADAARGEKAVDHCIEALMSAGRHPGRPAHAGGDRTL